jgi:hypothetical protein
LLIDAIGSVAAPLCSRHDDEASIAKLISKTAIRDEIAECLLGQGLLTMDPRPCLQRIGSSFLEANALHYDEKEGAFMRINTSGIDITLSCLLLADFDEKGFC